MTLFFRNILYTIFILSSISAHGMSTTAIDTQKKEFYQLIAEYKKRTQASERITPEMETLLKKARDIIDRIRPYTNTTDLDIEYFSTLRTGQSSTALVVNEQFNLLTTALVGTKKLPTLSFATIVNNIKKDLDALIARIYPANMIKENEGVFSWLKVYESVHLTPFLNMFGTKSSTQPYQHGYQDFEESQTAFLQELHDILTHIYPTLSANPSDLLQFYEKTKKTIFQDLYNDLIGYKDLTKRIFSTDNITQIFGYLDNKVMTPLAKLHYPTLNTSENAIVYDTSGKVQDIFLPTIQDSFSPNISFAQFINGLTDPKKGFIARSQKAWTLYGKTEGYKTQIPALKKEIAQLEEQVKDINAMKSLIQNGKQKYNNLPADQKLKSKNDMLEWIKPSSGSNFWIFWTTMSKKDEFLTELMMEAITYLATGQVKQMSVKKSQQPVTPPTPATGNTPTGSTSTGSTPQATRLKVSAPLLSATNSLIRAFNKGIVDTDNKKLGELFNYKEGNFIDFFEKINIFGDTNSSLSLQKIDIQQFDLEKKALEQQKNSIKTAFEKFLANLTFTPSFTYNKESTIIGTKNGATIIDNSTFKITIEQLVNAMPKKSSSQQPSKQPSTPPAGPTIPSTTSTTTPPSTPSTSTATPAAPAQTPKDIILSDNFTNSFNALFRSLDSKLDISNKTHPLSNKETSGVSESLSKNYQNLVIALLEYTPDLSQTLKTEIAKNNNLTNETLASYANTIISLLNKMFLTIDSAQTESAGVGIGGVFGQYQRLSKNNIILATNIPAFKNAIIELIQAAATWQ